MSSRGACDEESLKHSVDGSVEEEASAEFLPVTFVYSVASWEFLALRARNDIKRGGHATPCHSEERSDEESLSYSVRGPFEGENDYGYPFR
jgi:hypothetical protein